MNKPLLAAGLSRGRKSAVAGMFALAAGLTVPHAQVHAVQATARFDVAIVLRAAPQTGLCTNLNGTGVFGATVTVVCSFASNPDTGSGADVPPASGGTSPPASDGTSLPAANSTSLPFARGPRPSLPIPGAAYRFVTFISGSQLSGIVDAYTSGGTSTAFRVVSLADREYIEMTVGW